ncbi:MAG: hypothetical protein U1E51_07665 [Candidatus Binatia bacterium]|nr:hypothetical protein [Candidatus Binatia bacterium]
MTMSMEQGKADLKKRLAAGRRRFSVPSIMEKTMPAHQMDALIQGKFGPGKSLTFTVVERDESGLVKKFTVTED